MIAISERNARSWSLVLGSAAGFAASVGEYLGGQITTAVAALVAGVLFGLLALLYWRGWMAAPLLATLIATVTIIVVNDTNSLLSGALIAATFALLLANAWWVLGIGGVVAISLMVRELLLQGSISTTSITGFPVALVLTGMMALTRFVLEAEIRKSEALAAQAQAAQLQSKAQAAELAAQAATLAEQNEQQRKLVELVSTLEIPAVTIGEGILLAPIVGNVDRDRAGALTSRLLQRVNVERVRMVVLDLSGVAAVDTAVAQSLLQMIQAVQLLGCEVILTGIASSVATTMTQLNLGFGGTKIVRSPQEALAVATSAMAEVLK